MFKFNNTHIFTGYLKQKLSSVYIPTCKIYTKEFADYYDKYKQEDPRVIESIENVDYRKTHSGLDIRLETCVNYLKNNELYKYLWDINKDLDTGLIHKSLSWIRTSSLFYDSEKHTPGLTKSLHSPGRVYDYITHEYLGDYLRFMRDYYNINLMSLYNCFNNKICNNINYSFMVKDKKVTFNSQDSKYNIYAIPVKLFNNYTIAIDSYQGIEVFCGLYNTNLDVSDKSKDLITKTYAKIGNSIFKQPFLYDKLDVKYWNYENEIHEVEIDEKTKEKKFRLNNSVISRWDVANREQDLRLFIKVPTSCRSSIVVLEGDFRYFNNAKYAPITINDSTYWAYQQNHAVINFKMSNDTLNDSDFTPISKLQLLEFNTGESYPFADRLVEYLSESAITPIDTIPDNIKRAQKVMNHNQYYFKIDGLWENKMQKILYDYMINSGPIEVKDGKLRDKHSGNNPKNHGYHPRLGHTTKSTLYDILGYVDRDVEKWYSSWKNEGGKATVRDSIQNVDIYDGLYDI